MEGEINNESTDIGSEIMVSWGGITSPVWTWPKE
jgi:hypothetical protein